MISLTVELVKMFEGYRRTAYLCPAGVWTIGYGTTRYPGGVRVKPGQTCTYEQAMQWLNHELLYAEVQVQRLISVPLSQEQLGALTSFVYNLGAGSFRASTLRRRVNALDWSDVPKQFRRWVYAGGRRLRGLERRREEEVELWMSAWVDLWMTSVDL